MVPSEHLDRFRADLDALIEPGTPFGVAVSGGPDSLALLLLAAEARPGEIAAATVDHGLRPESRDEAEAVAVRRARGHRVELDAVGDPGLLRAAACYAAPCRYRAPSTRR